ncbi:MAG: hemolysin III family protein [Bacteriovorax sp.]|nr:hemolysin III family protein [Bacteriovorax sp.]
MKTIKDTKPLIKPLLRGHSHQAAFFFALGACAVLLLNAHGTRTIVATIIYSFSLIGLFGISAVYHRPTWQPQQRMWMRRMDHAAIYVLIAGTSTPICLLALSPMAGMKLLELVWSAALFGIIQSLFWVTAPKWVSSVLYVTVGCLIVPYLPELKAALTMNDVWLILTGGVVYVIGAIIYALRRPNPNPKIFGYHEIFHLLVIAGAGFHFLVIYKLIK